MRSVVVLLVVVAAFIAGPALVAAQGLIGLPSLFGKGADCDPMARFSVYTGYASNAGITKFKFTSQDGFFFGARDYIYDYAPTSAFYIATECPIELGNMGKALLSGSVALPATWDQQFYVLNPPLGLAGSSRSPADTIWFTMQGLWAYPIGGSGFSALGGFRWDHWQTSLKSRTDIAGILASPTDTGALTLNGYLPMVGGMTEYQGFVFGVVGFPWLPGDFEYGQSFNLGGPTYLSGSGNFNKGYYVEFFTEYGLPVPGLVDFDGTVSLFGKLSLMEAKSQATFSRFIGPGVVAETDAVDVAFNRTMFVVGGKASVSFNIPNVWDRL